MTSARLDFAVERTKAAGEAYAKARDVLDAAEAEELRVRLCDLADEHGIVAFSYETNYEYDDEGSYFPSVSMRGATADDEEMAEDAVYDAANDVSHRAVDLLFGSERDGEITIEQLRRKHF